MSETQQAPALTEAQLKEQQAAIDKAKADRAAKLAELNDKLSKAKAIAAGFNAMDEATLTVLKTAKPDVVSSALDAPAKIEAEIKAFKLSSLPADERKARTDHEALVTAFEKARQAVEDSKAAFIARYPESDFFGNKTADKKTRKSKDAPEGAGVYTGDLLSAEDTLAKVKELAAQGITSESEMAVKMYGEGVVLGKNPTMRARIHGARDKAGLLAK